MSDGAELVVPVASELELSKRVGNAWRAPNPPKAAALKALLGSWNKLIVAGLRPEVDD